MDKIVFTSVEPNLHRVLVSQRTRWAPIKPRWGGKGFETQTLRTVWHVG